MVKFIKIGRHRYSFSFDIKDGKAVNGCFNAANKAFVDDFILEYGPGADIRDVIQQLSDKIKRYNVVINETSSKNLTYEVYGLNEDDAKDAAMDAEGYLIDVLENDTSLDIVSCDLVLEDTDENV
jgi:hypothetical protein